jgi:hypothetical protein
MLDSYDREMQKKLKKLYKEMNKKPYGEREEWEKFLTNNRSEYKKKQKKIKQHEISLEEMDRFSL